MLMVAFKYVTGLKCKIGLKLKVQLICLKEGPYYFIVMPKCKVYQGSNMSLLFSPTGRGKMTIWRAKGSERDVAKSYRAYLNWNNWSEKLATQIQFVLHFNPLSSPRIYQSAQNAEHMAWDCDVWYRINEQRGFKNNMSPSQASIIQH